MQSTGYRVDKGINLCAYPAPCTQYHVPYLGGLMKHTICCFVENKFGVLARIAGLFSARGFNIDSLVVGETEDPTMSRMTIVVKADEKILEQVIKQLRKLIDVIKVIDMRGLSYVEKELMLIKVNVAGASQKQEIMQAIKIYRAKVVDMCQKSLMIEITGNEKKIESFIENMRPFGIKEVARTGKIAMQRK